MGAGSVTVELGGRKDALGGGVTSQWARSSLEEMVSSKSCQS